MGLIDNIIGVESGGNPTAKNPNSTATGAGQFIAATWIDTLSRHRPDLVQGKTPEEILALRNDPALSREMTEAYANQNQAILTKSGVPVTDGNTYLAHFAGPGGAVKVLQADPGAPVGDILGAAVVKANPFLARMTAGDLQAWASKKVGGGAPQAAAAPQAPAAPPSAPPQTAGLLNVPANPAAQASPAGMGQAPGGLFAQMPAEQQMQAPPIFYAPRRQQDLSKLRAAFKAPMLSRG